MDARPPASNSESASATIIASTMPADHCPENYWSTLYRLHPAPDKVREVDKRRHGRAEDHNQTVQQQLLIGKLGPHYLQSRFKQFRSKHQRHNALERNMVDANNMCSVPMSL